MKGFRTIAGVVVVALFLVAAAGWSAFAQAAPKVPVVSDIHGRIRPGEAHVAFNLKNAFSPEMVEALKSGIEISFKTDIRIEVVRHGWFNDTIGEAEVVRTVHFDALSRVYRLTRGGREEHIDDVFGALAGMTSYEVNIPVSSDPVPGNSYRVRIRTRLDRVGLTEPLRSILFFSSLWDLETPWARGYLAIQ
ncbi:MAG TPA: DUF4390 domain-containing protein [Candidatus Deferrimicrobiaceae bacterium]